MEIEYVIHRIGCQYLKYHSIITMVIDDFVINCSGCNINSFFGKKMI